MSDDDDYRGIKFFHPSGLGVVLVTIDRNDVDELCAVFSVEEITLSEYFELISSLFDHYEI